MDLLRGLNEADANATKLLFDRDEVVRFICFDYKVHDEKGHIMLRCKVDSGVHKGKDYTIFISAGDNEVQKKRYAQFFYKSNLWTPAELAHRDPDTKASTVKLSRACGKILQGKASKVTDGKEDGTKFQDIIDLRLVGDADPAVIDAAKASTKTGAAPSAAAVAANATSF